jgi:hypothetical protein
MKTDVGAAVLYENIGCSGGDSLKAGQHTAIYRESSSSTGTQMAKSGDFTF